MAFGRIAIALAPIAAGNDEEGEERNAATGRAVVYGLTWAWVWMDHATDNRADLWPDGEGYLRSNAAGEVEILWSDPGDPDDDWEAGLKWALVHVGRRARTSFSARITGGIVVNNRWRYRWEEVRVDGDSESDTFGDFITVPGGLVADHDAFAYLRAINRLEARYKSGETHTSTAEWPVAVPTGTIVELRPELDSRGATVWIFDFETPPVMKGVITAVSGADASDPTTTPVVASGVTYTVRIIDREASPSISGVRAYWGNPLMETGKIIPAVAGDHCLVASFSDGEGGFTWRALIAERFKTRGC